jgi:hypothetical protein
MQATHDVDRSVATAGVHSRRGRAATTQHAPSLALIGARRVYGVRLTRKDVCVWTPSSSGSDAEQLPTLSSFDVLSMRAVGQQPVSGPSSHFTGAVDKARSAMREAITAELGQAHEVSGARWDATGRLLIDEPLGWTAKPTFPTPANKGDRTPPAEVRVYGAKPAWLRADTRHQSPPSTLASTDRCLFALSTSTTSTLYNQPSPRLQRSVPWRPEGDSPRQARPSPPAGARLSRNRYASEINLSAVHRQMRNDAMSRGDGGVLGGCSYSKPHA